MSKLHLPVFNFDINEESAKDDYKLMKDKTIYLETLIDQKTSVKSYSSEFKSVHDLEDLLHKHPRWKALKSRLEKGVNFPLNKLTKELQLKYLE